MPTRRPKSAPFPSREKVLQYIRESPGRVGKREIARAFRLDTSQRAKLKTLLRDLERDGDIDRGHKRRFSGAGSLPNVAVVEITGTDADGDVLARPVAWHADVAPPLIRMAPEARGRGAPGRGDRILARLTREADNVYLARTIRRLEAAPKTVLGVYARDGSAGRLHPVDRRQRSEFTIAPEDAGDAKPGDLVWAEATRGRRLGLPRARIIERLAHTEGPRSISLIAIHEHDIPVHFPKAALDQAAKAGPAPARGREDLRDIPLVTIDGADARDFDDAVWAEPDPDPRNAGGWHLIVAIADVAWYVRPKSPLDAAAYERGTSVYFPDRVVPMLPEALSNGWCSLKPGEDRPCLAAHLWIGSDGTLKRHRFVRAVMRSTARLTYDEAQAAHDGAPGDAVRPLMEAVIAPLYGAYRALAAARAKRGVLDLDLGERQVILDDDGGVARIEERPRRDSHRLIEEFMITANVAAAEALEKLRQPCMYRIHDQPTREKLETLRTVLETLDLRLARGQVITAAHFNHILARVADTPHVHLVSQLVLRTQAQAEYNPDNIGHFGLALRRYAHFTSPIRRYPDLLVHRALIQGLGLGAGALEKEHADFTDLGKHLSATERRAAAAERGAMDRFTVAYLADKTGLVFSGRINGVTRFGVFVTLKDSGGDGLVPMRALPDDYYVLDEDHQMLRGRAMGREYRLGDEVEVLLAEADAITGSLILHMVDGGGPTTKGRSKAKKGRPRGRGRRR